MKNRHLFAIASMICWAIGTANAGLTDLSDSPMANSNPAQAKPNIMLLMDTSSSMGWTHMPDGLEGAPVNNIPQGTRKVGYKSPQCNGIYYNPTTLYSLPKKADGTYQTLPSFTSARYDPYDTANLTTTDLSTSFKAYDGKTLAYGGDLVSSDYNDTPQPAYYYLYEGSQTITASSAACQDADTGATRSATGGGTWRRVLVSSTSGTSASDERQNFANWYSYYRTRLLMVKSAASLAFDSLNDGFRVGFVTMHPKDAVGDATVSAAKYLQIADFNITQRGLWFDKLFSQKASGASPAREGLARVGRHYAGKSDSINAGMTGDPMQYSCQQNFTILTTDGYWNDQWESSGKGPVALDGTSRVGQQDGTLTGNDGWTPRPIWEGFADTKTVETNNENLYYFDACPTGYFDKTTTQILRSQQQMLKHTSQMLQGTLTRYRSTSQQLQSTLQNIAHTVQNIEHSWQNTQTVTIARESRTQNLQSTSQNRKNTFQILKTQTKVEKSTQQWLKSTTRIDQTTTAWKRTQTVIRWRNPSTESWEPVASCPAGGECTSQTVGTANEPVASCTASGPTSGNGYVTTTCNNTGGTSGVASCTPQSASAGNGYVGVTCDTSTTNNVPSASCSPASASSGNSWTSTTCSSNSTGPTLVASCTAASANSGNSYISTTCNTTVVSASTPVSSCTADSASSGNGYVTTSCFNNDQYNIPVASCTAVPASSGNSWTRTECPAPATTTNVPVASCTTQPASSGNNWTSTTCSTNNTSNVAVASCWPQSPNWWNGFTTITCTTQTVSGPTVVASCTPVAPNSGNGYQNTTCGIINESWTPVQVCNPQTANGGNGNVNIACSQKIADTPVATCIPSLATSGNGWVTTTCPAPNITTDVPVASCSPAGASAGNNWTKITCRTVTTGPTAVATCDNQAAAGWNSWTATSCSQVTTPGVAVSNCSTVAPVIGNGFVETTCAPVDNEFAVETCSPSVKSALNSWVTTTCIPNNSTDVPVPSCTDQPASSGNQWTTTSCRTLTSPTTRTTSCTAASANNGNNYVTTACVPVMGDKGRYRTTETVTTRFYSGSILIPERTTISNTTGAPADMNGVCYAAGVPAGAAPELPTPNPQAAGLNISPWPTIGPMPPAGCSGWPCTQGTAITGGSIDSLADVAQYYYVNDLRPEMANDLLGTGSGPEDDRAKHQHMTTFTLALGVSGTLNYQKDYKTSATGDFADIRVGAKNWPLWPDPDLGDWNNATKSYATKSYWENPRSIDDFWHAAVNGRGQFFSASTPTSVVTGLSGALSGIQARLAAGAAAGTSSLTPVAGDNFYFAGRYTTSQWTGELEVKTIGVTSGAFGNTAAWSAAGKLNAMTGQACDNRKIYLIRDGASNNLTPFTWNTYACDATYGQSGSAQTDLNATEQAQFGVLKAGLLSQYGLMTDGTNGTVNQKTPTEGANLVNFLRGQRQFEGFEPGVAGKYYRTRGGVLGDIVSAQPVYVRKPFAQYADAGYGAFKTANASRTPMVYVGANDGMLHAFKATVFQSDGVTVDPEGGKELWAVIPSSVLPDLYKLADNNYANAHRFYVDGTPTVGDIDANAPLASPTAPSNWKTILVGGLNKGGKGYYALDVTNPATPKALWEFKWGATCGGAHEDCHLGYSYGSPIVTKLANGQWVVLLTSGYNNVNSPTATGDGKGYLYVLNADTGELLLKLATTEGSDATPSGLAQISAFVEDGAINNMTERVYGADLSGNLWRFQFKFTGNILSGGSVVLVGTAKDANGVAQPITTKPLLTEYKGETMVLFGTGKLLGVADLDPAVASNSQTQSVYAVKDPEPFSTTTLHTNLRGALAPLAISQSGTTRTAACTGTLTECDRDAGWVLNLPDTGERVNVDMRLAYGTLVFASNVPSADACSIGGYSWLNYVNYRTGMQPSRMPDGVSTSIQDSLIVGVNITYTQDINGQWNPSGHIETSKPPGVDKPLPPDTPDPIGRRTSWREIIAQ